MSDSIKPSDISFRQPWPMHHMQPSGGYLPVTKEAAALWQFLILAVQALDKIPKQTTLEGDDDQTVDMMQLATSSAMIFGITDLNTMFTGALINAARLEAFRSALVWDDRLNAFFDSGGKSYRILTRDPDKTGT